MRDPEDLGALEVRIVRLLLEGDQRAEEVARALDAHLPSGIGTTVADPNAGTEDLARTAAVRIARSPCGR